MPYDAMNPNAAKGDIGAVLEAMDEIMLSNMLLNDKAMKYCHMWGFNGFKRLHRYNDRCFLEYHIQLNNEAYDKYRMVLDTKVVEFDYKPMDLVDHLQKWENMLKEDIHELGKLNNKYREMAGKGNCVAEDAMHLMARNYEKAGRYAKRFAETKSMHDMHSLDDEIHVKMKAKEEAEGHSY